LRILFKIVIFFYAIVCLGAASEGRCRLLAIYVVQVHAPSRRSRDPEFNRDLDLDPGDIPDLAGRSRLQIRSVSSARRRRGAIVSR